MTTTIRNVDKKVFAEFKAEAVSEGLSIGEALNLAIVAWLDRRKKQKLKFLEFKPSKWGKETKKTSRELDHLLYGD